MYTSGKAFFDCVKHLQDLSALLLEDEEAKTGKEEAEEDERGDEEDAESLRSLQFSESLPLARLSLLRDSCKLHSWGKMEKELAHIYLLFCLIRSCKKDSFSVLHLFHR